MPPFAPCQPWAYSTILIGFPELRIPRQLMIAARAITRSLQGDSMSNMGKSHLVIMFTVGPDDVAEGDRLFASHGEFMKGHPREGDVALLDYTVSKGPELSNPMDPNSEPTGNTIFVVDEYYESPAGIARHWQDTTENWPEMSSAAPAWFAKATIVTLHNGTAVQALQ
jgi:hypothetical protein